MTRFFVHTVAVFLYLWTLPLNANTFTAPTNFADERELFSTAIKALSNGNKTQFKIAKSELKDYPLYPYLDYADISLNLRSSSESRVRDFLNTHADTPVSARLRNQWLNYLRRKNDWKTYLNYYSDGNSSQQCFYALALYRNGDKQQGFNEALKLWNVGKSQPKACDKLFHLLISNQQVTEAIAWQRYQKASAANNKKLSRYLKRFFTSPSYQKAYANYEIIKRAPERIRKHADFNDQSDPNKAVLARALKLLAKKDPLVARKEWQYFKDQFSFSPKQSQNIETTLIKKLIEKGLVQQGDGLLQTSKELVSSDLLEWRIRQALTSSDWANVRYWINQLPVELADEQRWRYWLARAETQMTPASELKDHPLIPALAKERGYYSFLAADELQQAYEMEYQASQIEPEIVTSLETNPAIIRARELYLVGEQVNAVREWSAAGKNFTAKEWEATGLAFYEWGWHHIAIMSMVRARSWQDIVVRFPVLHEQQYREHAAKYQLNAQLLMAITRQESAFNVKANSPSNAKGLMQLLPSTAKYIAKKRFIPYKSSADLLDADKNIALGSVYFKYLMEKFDDNRAVSIASYNAGPGRVGKWLDVSAGQLPVDIWVETIPYSETRRYVQNVLAFSVIYAQHLGEATQLFTYNEKAKAL